MDRFQLHLISYLPPNTINGPEEAVHFFLKVVSVISGKIPGRTSDISHLHFHDLDGNSTDPRKAVPARDGRKCHSKPAEKWREPLGLKWEFQCFFQVTHLKTNIANGNLQIFIGDIHLEMVVFSLPCYFFGVYLILNADK